tara:strand:+ start:1642 stop:1920 length:279 start_codon:yes stop_codon:yes gene_type:complete
MHYRYHRLRTLYDVWFEIVDCESEQCFAALKTNQIDNFVFTYVKKEVGIDLNQDEINLISKIILRFFSDTQTDENLNNYCCNYELPLSIYYL